MSRILAYDWADIISAAGFGIAGVDKFAFSNLISAYKAPGTANLSR